MTCDCHVVIRFCPYLVYSGVLWEPLYNANSRVESGRFSSWMGAQGWRSHSTKHTKLPSYNFFSIHNLDRRYFKGRNGTSIDFLHTVAPRNACTYREYSIPVFFIWDLLSPSILLWYGSLILGKMSRLFCYLPIPRTINLSSYCTYASWAFMHFRILYPWIQVDK